MVRNVHERLLAAGPDEVGALLDTLSSHDDRLWPNRRWPAMRLDRAEAELSGDEWRMRPLSAPVRSLRAGARRFA